MKFENMEVPQIPHYHHSTQAALKTGRKTLVITGLVQSIFGVRNFLFWIRWLLLTAFSCLIYSCAPVSDRKWCFQPIPTHIQTRQLLSQLRPSAGKSQIFSRELEREKSVTTQTCAPSFAFARRERELQTEANFRIKFCLDGKGAASGPVHHWNIFFFVRLYLFFLSFYFILEKEKKNVTLKISSRIFFGILSRIK